MGAWGVGMQENDSASEAVDSFSCKIRDGGKPLDEKLIIQIFDKVVPDPVENPENVLGIAHYLYLHQLSIFPIRKHVLIAIDQEMRAASDWRNPLKRKNALRKFAKAISA